jgi:hypothetical protein
MAEHTDTASSDEERKVEVGAIPPRMMHGLPPDPDEGLSDAEKAAIVRSSCAPSTPPSRVNKPARTADFSGNSISDCKPFSPLTSARDLRYQVLTQTTASPGSASCTSSPSSTEPTSATPKSSGSPQTYTWTPPALNTTMPSPSSSSPTRSSSRSPTSSSSASGPPSSSRPSCWPGEWSWSPWA